MAGAGAVLALAVGFIIFGYWKAVVQPRNRTVLEADGIRISYSALKRRMVYEFSQNPAYQQGGISSLAQATYQTALDEITVITRAESDRGVKPGPAEVDLQLRAKLHVASNVDQRVFADAFRRELEATGLHEDEYRRVVLAQLLKQKLEQKFHSEIPATLPQAKVEVVAVNSQEEANKAITRIKAGEDWATVATAISTEPDKATTGGVHEYTPEGTLNPAYDSYAFTAPVGEISKPLASADGSMYYVVRVADRADKSVTAEQKNTLVSKKYNDWLKDMQSRMKITDRWDQQTQTAALIAIQSKLLDIARKNAEQQQNSKPVQAPSPPSTAPEPAASPATSSGGSGNPPVPNAPVAPGGGNAP